MKSTEGTNHGTFRKNATIAGILYILGTVAGILSLVFTSPVIEEPDYLTQISINSNRIITGTLFVLIMGLALVMVPVVIYPVLKKFNEVLAVGYIVFRGALEGVTYLILVIGWLSLPLISQGYVMAGAVNASYFQSLGDLVLEVHDQIGNVLTIVFILGALMFYYVLFQSKLVPRWVSGWGLLAAIPYFVSGVLGLFATLSPMSSTQMVLVLPLAVQEMVLAIWLIVKGFNPSVLASESI